MSSRARTVRISVTDTGEGMDRATRDRVFEPFFTTKEAGRGTGLGLSTVLAIVRQLGGAVEVDSECGRGTRFRLLFPALDGADGPAMAVEDAPRGNGTVLLVEDERLVRIAVRHYLQGLGYRTLVAAGAAEALRISEQHAGPIHALLTDVVMPDGLGKEVALRALARHPDLRVIYMSAHSREELDELGRLDGEAKLLQKPFDERSLALALSEALTHDRPPAGAGGRETILVVESSDAARLAMREYLEEMGYRVLATARATEALELARRHRIDLLLADCALPEMRGDELAQCLRLEQPGIQVILRPGAEERATRAGERPAGRPVDLDRLGSEVRSSLARRQ